MARGLFPCCGLGGPLPTPGLRACCQRLVTCHPCGDLHLVSARSPSSASAVRLFVVCWQRRLSHGAHSWPAERGRPVWRKLRVLKITVWTLPRAEGASRHKFVGQTSWCHFTGGRTFASCVDSVLPCVLELAFPEASGPAGVCTPAVCELGVLWERSLSQRQQAVEGRKEGSGPGRQRQGRGGPS